jgi:hypothetical protein
MQGHILDELMHKLVLLVPWVWWLLWKRGKATTFSKYKLAMGYEWLCSIAFLED